MTVDELCASHARVGLDANVFVYLFETSGPLADASAAVIDRIDGGTIRGCVSTLLISEVLGGPARGGDVALMERYADEIEGMSNLEILPVNRNIAFDAALVSARDRLTLADAVHVAAARAAGATAFVTNDRGIRSAPGLDVVYLSDLASTEPASTG